MTFLRIKELEPQQIPLITQWARDEGFAPGVGDVEIYRHTDRQGVWIGWLGSEPVGCIAGVKYNLDYGFVGLYIVIPEHRGHGYGQALWKHALNHLSDVSCVGLEAIDTRIEDYSAWGFEASTPTTRWQSINPQPCEQDAISLPEGMSIQSGEHMASTAVQIYDAQRELSPRPHFLADWLSHPAGEVLTLRDQSGGCHGFARIRPCFLRAGQGWRIGPLLADTADLAGALLQSFIQHYSGVILIDTPGLNPRAADLMTKLGFERQAQTMRMYRGVLPTVAMDEVFALACLELG